MALSISSPAPPPSTPTAPGASPRYTSALAALTVLFFMMGFITCLNDILIPYLKGLFSLNYTKALLVNSCFFGAYLIMGIPAGYVVKKLGYKRGMLLGFLVAALGCFLFFPAAGQRAFGLFLGALFVLASGVVMLQVAGNPYVAILGPPESASARLTLTQAFNSLATAIAPPLGTALILSNLPDLKKLTPADAARIDVAPVQSLYLYIGVALVVISVLLFFLRLPVIKHTEAAPGDTSSAWSYRHLLLGMVGIFTYVGAEVAIGSIMLNYLQEKEVMDLSSVSAGNKVGLYWLGAMVGRFIGVAVLSKVRPSRVLTFNAAIAVVLVLISVNSTGPVAMYSMLAVGLMNSIMFPTIFTLAVAGLGRHTEQASGLLSAAIVGGAVIPPLFGVIADSSLGGGGIHAFRLAYLLPVLCYAYIAWYGLRGHKPEPTGLEIAPETPAFT